MSHQAPKKVASFAVALALTLSTAMPAFAASFMDTNGHWAQQSIESLSQRGVITGYPGGQFMPEGHVTRAEFATILTKALNLPPSSMGYSQFNDVATTFWGSPAIASVANQGLVSGYPGGYFLPGKQISRVEAISVLAKASKAPMPSPQEAASILSQFGDGASVPQWAQPAVAAAVKSGIFTNFPNTTMIEPTQLATRAEIAVMADKLGNYLAQGNTNTPWQPAPNTTGNNPWQQPNTTGGMSQQGSTLKGFVSIAPANTMFSGIASQAFSSDRSRLGDMVSLTLDRPILSSNGQIMIPQGSMVEGTITSITNAGRTGKNGSIGVNFNRVTTPDGQTFAVSAEFNADKGLLTGGTTKGRIAKAAIKTGAGAAIGGAAGAIIGAIKGGGKADNYALQGAAIGAAAGGTTAVMSKGQEVIVNQGDALEIRLRQPLTLSN